jgi:LacI family gluconate utilization system Gnt-I transcriptional repressor
MLSWNIDGLILTERTHTPRTLKMIEVAGIPVVELMDSKSPCLDIAVGFDNFEAARQMTAAIIERGHRRVAYRAHVSTNVLSSNRRGMSRRCLMRV